MINVKEIIEIDGIYISALWKDFYAVDVFVKRGELIFKIRYPYNTRDKAQQSMRAMKAKNQQDILIPDYKPFIWFAGYTNKEKEL